MSRPKQVEPRPAAGARKDDKDEAGVLADRLRAHLPTDGLSEQRMFGGIGFMLNGNMIAGASKRGLLLRVGKENHVMALARPGARPMEMRGRPVEGYIRLDPTGLSDAALRDWLQLALAFVRTLPSKPKQKKGSRA